MDFALYKNFIIINNNIIIYFISEIIHRHIKNIIHTYKINSANIKDNVVLKNAKIKIISRDKTLKDHF